MRGGSASDATSSGSPNTTSSTRLDALGVSASNRTLSAMEHGQGVDVGRLPELAVALDCSVTYLLGLTEEPAAVGAGRVPGAATHDSDGTASGARGAGRPAAAAHRLDTRSGNPRNRRLDATRAMHELSLCGAIAEIASRRAGDRTVGVIHLQYRAAAPGGPGHADLLLVHGQRGHRPGRFGAGGRAGAGRAAVPRLRRTRLSWASAIAFACAACGGLDVEAVAGEEFLVTELELAGASDVGRFHRHDDGTVHEHAPRSWRSHEQPPRPTTVGDHSGYATGPERVSVLERIFDENDRLAGANRHDLDAAGVVAVNVMSSPGAGKTTVLRETLSRLGDAAAGRGRRGRHRDEPRRRPACAASAQQVELVNTGNGFGGECHLDAPMVALGAACGCRSTSWISSSSRTSATWSARPSSTSASTPRAMVYSVTEGEDKPLKYPVMFRSADLVARQQDRPAAAPGLRPAAVRGATSRR